MNNQESQNETYMRAWKQGRYDTLKMILELTKHYDTKEQVINCIESSLETIIKQGGYDYE